MWGEILKRVKDRAYKEMEKRLDKYRLLDPEIEKLKIKIKDIERDINGCKAINYSGAKTGDTYKFNSAVENESESIQRRIKPLQRKIESMELEKENITNAKKVLDEREEKFFLIYFEGKKMNMKKVAEKMYLSRSSCYLVKEDIIFKMLDFLGN